MSMKNSHFIGNPIVRTVRAATETLTAKYYLFEQEWLGGGSYYIDRELGIGNYLIIKAPHHNMARDAIRLITQFHGYGDNWDDYSIPATIFKSEDAAIQKIMQGLSYYPDYRTMPKFRKSNGVLIYTHCTITLKIIERYYPNEPTD